MNHQIIEQYKVPIVFGAVGISFLIVTLILVFDSSSSDAHVSDGFEVKTDSQSEIAPKSKIVVDLQGAVVQPGVYEIESEARAIELVERAGGFLDQADQEWIAKNLNLAMPLSDGLKMYIPFIGEQGVSDTDFGSENTMININTASASELETLTGIGVKTSEKIINGRPYQTIDELREKSIVGEKTFENIQDKIAVY